MQMERNFVLGTRVNSGGTQKRTENSNNRPLQENYEKLASVRHDVKEKVNV